MKLLFMLRTIYDQILYLVCYIIIHAYSGKILRYIPSTFQRKHRDLVLASIQQWSSQTAITIVTNSNGKKSSSSVLECIPNEFKNDKEIIQIAIKRNDTGHDVLSHTSLTLRDDIDVVQQAVMQDGYALRHASSRLQDNKNIALHAVKQNAYALEYASQNLQEDAEVFMAAIRQLKEQESSDASVDSFLLEHASKRLLQHSVLRSGVINSIRKNGNMLQFAHDAVKSDKEIVMIAVKQNGHALNHASRTLVEKEEDLIVAAIDQVKREDGKHSVNLHFRFASKSLLQKKEFKSFILDVVRQNGVALAYGSDELKGDKEVVLAAVQENSMALQFASSAMKKDEEIALAAAQQNSKKN